MFTKRNTYSEGISRGTVFVLTDSENKPKNLPCWCKDYFQDYFWTQHTKEPVDIYGYKITPEKKLDNYYKYHIKLGNKYIRDGTGYKFEKYPEDSLSKLTSFLQGLAHDLKLSKPHVEAGKSDEGDIVILFNKDWYKYPYLHSLFTSAIRLGCWITYEEFKTQSNKELKTPHKNTVHDLSYSYDVVRNKALKLIAGGLKEIPWTAYNSNTIHSSSGIQNTTL